MEIILFIYQYIVEISGEIGDLGYFIGILLVSFLLGITYIRMEDREHSHTS